MGIMQRAASDEVAAKADSRVCRICFSSHVDDKQGPVVSLGCLCRGDLGFAHTKCLKRWVNSRNHLRCEICLSNFSSRHTKLFAFHHRHRRTSSYESISPGSVTIDRSNSIIYFFGYKIFVNVKQPLLAVALCLVIILEMLQFASSLPPMYSFLE